MLIYILGIITGTMIIEPTIINCIYMGNVNLFNDIILSEKSRKKLRKYYNEK